MSKIVTVEELRQALAQVPGEYEVIASVINCVANIKTIVIHTNEPIVMLYDRDRSPQPDAEAPPGPRVLHDQSKMPWGKYKDHKLQDIPASYFHFLWCGEKNPRPLKGQEKTNEVASYIARRMVVLKSDYPDGIWR